MLIICELICVNAFFMNEANTFFNYDDNLYYVNFFYYGYISGSILTLFLLEMYMIRLLFFCIPVSFQLEGFVFKERR